MKQQWLPTLLLCLCLAPPTVSPAPDSILRVHIVYRACGADTVVEPQPLPTFTRDGFTVAERGVTRTG